MAASAHHSLPASLAGIDWATVAVIGDIMLDVYLQGSVERISPEAPVPVISLAAERLVAGGAANVAANIASLGGKVRLVGVVGRDGDRERLLDVLAGFGGIDTDGIVADAGRPTTTKTRVLGVRQQIARLDRESTAPLSNEALGRLLDSAVAAVDGSDAVIVSDYGKGVISDRVVKKVIAHARQRGMEVIVDPKRRDFSGYRGATVITPNQAELAAATGVMGREDEDIARAAQLAQGVCGAGILVTRSERGMSFFSTSGEVINLPTVAREVFDVSGAGDTVVATIALMLAATHPMADAMRVANHAAGVVVGKLGTATVTQAELIAAMRTATIDADVTDGRLMTWPQLQAQREAWRRAGLKVGIANGCFDLLHPGHVALIGEAAASCDRLVMALNADSSVRRLKGPTRPVQDEAARARVIGAIKGVAAVVLFGEDTPLELLRMLVPDVLVKGADYRIDQVVGADIVEAAGGCVVLVDLVPGQSTTRIIASGADGAQKSE